jgi:ElaB/YqjD/DUF883 family membrane-anchored ribosome-binding protein
MNDWQMAQQLLMQASELAGQESKTAKRKAAQKLNQAADICNTLALSIYKFNT